MLEDKANLIGSNKLQKSSDFNQEKVIKAQNWQINFQKKVKLIVTKNNYAEFDFGDNYLRK